MLGCGGRRSTPARGAIAAARSEGGAAAGVDGSEGTLPSLLLAVAAGELTGELGLGEQAAPLTGGRGSTGRSGHRIAHPPAESRTTKCVIVRSSIALRHLSAVCAFVRCCPPLTCWPLEASLSLEGRPPLQAKWQVPRFGFPPLSVSATASEDAPSPPPLLDATDY